MPRHATPGRGSRGCPSRWTARRRSAPPAAGRPAGRAPSAATGRARSRGCRPRRRHPRASAGVASAARARAFVGLDLAVLRRRGGDERRRAGAGWCGRSRRRRGRTPPGWPATAWVVPLTLRTNCRAAAATSSLGGGRLEVVERADVAAHARREYVEAHTSKNDTSSPVISTTRPSGSGTSTHRRRRRCRTRPRPSGSPAEPPSTRQHRHPAGAALPALGDHDRRAPCRSRRAAR